MNDLSSITWFGKEDGTSNDNNEVFLYNGTTISQLTSDNNADMWPKINSQGRIVWERYDGSDWEIMLYTGTTIIQ